YDVPLFLNRHNKSSGFSCEIGNGRYGITIASWLIRIYFQTHPFYYFYFISSCYGRLQDSDFSTAELLLLSTGYHHHGLVRDTIHDCPPFAQCNFPPSPLWPSTTTPPPTLPPSHLPPCSTCFVKLGGSELAKDSPVRPKKFSLICYQRTQEHISTSCLPPAVNLRATNAQFCTTHIHHYYFLSSAPKVCEPINC
ncbi:uncharacterized protein BP01DRAFT_408977, partial [Aspergillus saccharolyticus JOP 1030-1]